MNREDRRYFESKEFQDILQRWESMLRSGQMGYMDASDLADLADYYYMVAQDDDAADEVIDFATTLHPDAVEVTIFKARRALRDADLDAADALCRQVEADDRHEAALLRTEIMVCRGENDHALDYVLTVAETDIAEDLDYFYYDAAYIFVEHDDMDSAETLAHRLEDMAPDWYSTWELLADIYISEELFEHALDYLKKMLDVAAFEVESWNWSAEAYSGLGNMDEAMESVDYALAIEPDNRRSLQLKAWLLANGNQPAEAHAIYEQLQQMQPADGEHWLYDVQPLLDTDHPQQALEVAHQALEILQTQDDTANIVYAHELMAQALCANKMFVEALGHLDKAEVLVSTDADKAEIQLMRARVFMLSNQHAQAMVCVENARKADPGHAAEVLFRGAALLYEYYYDAQALDMLRKADVLDDSLHHANCQAYIAACLINMGKEEQALAPLREAVKGKSDVLEELFAELFPAGIPPQDYPDHLFHSIHGRWPGQGEE